MIYKASVQIRGYKAKYPVYLEKEIETDSSELAIVLIWEWARKLKGTRGPHTVMNVRML